MTNQLFQQINKLKLLHNLIKQERTSSPGELARRLTLSRSKLYELTQELSMRGIAINYDRKMKSFYYVERYEFTISFEERNFFLALSPLTLLSASGVIPR